jgi:hypothetical protein
LRWVDPSAPGGRSAPRDVKHWKAGTDERAR